VRWLGKLRIPRPGEFWTLVKESLSAWTQDNVPRLGAALAFYAALSIAPLLVVVLATVGFLYGKAAVQGEIVWQIQSLVGREGARFIQGLIASAAHRPASGIIATIVGLVVLFVGASSAFAELQDALNTIWRAPAAKRRSGIASVFNLVKRRILYFVLVAGVGFLLLVSLLAGAGITAVETYFSRFLPMPAALLSLINFFISLVVITILFAVIYKVLPDVRLKWSDVWIGAAFTSLLFALGKIPIDWYLGTTTVASSYGAAGSFLILLLWVYYSAQVFFLGAEFTKFYTHHMGSHFQEKLLIGPQPQSEPQLQSKL